MLFVIMIKLSANIESKKVLDDIVADKLARNHSHALDIILNKIDEDTRVQIILFGRKLGEKKKDTL